MTEDVIKAFYAVDPIAAWYILALAFVVAALVLGSILRAIISFAHASGSFPERICEVLDKMTCPLLPM